MRTATQNAQSEAMTANPDYAILQTCLINWKNMPISVNPMRGSSDFSFGTNDSVMHKTMPAVLCSQTKFQKQTIIFPRFCRAV